MSRPRRSPDGPRVETGRRRRASKGDLKEAAILRCAWELLGSKPASDITIDELAKGAGLSRPTFYFYFPSREAVVRALAAEVGAQLLATFGEPLTTATDAPAVVVRRAVADYIEGWRTHGRVLRAMVPLYERDEELRRFWDDISARINGAFAASIQAERDAGRALPGPPAAAELAGALGAMLWRSGYELSLRPLSAPGQDDLVDTLTAVCLRAVYGSSPVDPG